MVIKTFFDREDIQYFQIYNTYNHIQIHINYIIQPGGGKLQARKNQAKMKKMTVVYNKKENNLYI